MIVFVTGNQGKREEVERYLGLPFEQVDLDLPEIQSLDPEEVVREKAEHAFRELCRPVLVEDVSMTFDALGKLPGPFIKFFEKELGNEGLCALLAGKEDRRSTATVSYGFHDGKAVHVFTADMEGTIAPCPKGERSFGWAPIFMPEGMEKTYAELSNEEQEAISYRRRALEKFRAYLEASGV